jgi:hypothetical protein
MSLCGSKIEESSRHHDLTGRMTIIGSFGHESFTARSVSAFRLSGGAGAYSANWNTRASKRQEQFES